MTKKRQQKKKSLEDRVMDRSMELHPVFLEALRDVYPLAVLGSLCIAIAAFTAQSELVSAQTYAIVAASLFLVSFVNSLCVRILKINFAAFSYVSVASAIISLFMVIFEFSKTIPAVGSAFFVVGEFFGLLLMTLGVVESARSLRVRTGITHHLGSTIFISWFASLLSVGVWLLLDKGTVVAFMVNIIASAFFALFAAGILLAFVFVYRESRRKKCKEKHRNEN